MKKNYQQPQIIVLNIGTYNFVCSSTISFSDAKATGSTTVDSRRSNGFWDDEGEGEWLE